MTLETSWEFESLKPSEICLPVSFVFTYLAHFTIRECVQQVFSLFFHMWFRLQGVFACIYTVPIDIMLTELAQSLSPDAYKVDRKVLSFLLWGKWASFVGFFCQIAGILGGRFDTLA